MQMPAENNPYKFEEVVNIKFVITLSYQRSAPMIKRRFSSQVHLSR